MRSKQEERSGCSTQGPLRREPYRSLIDAMRLAPTCNNNQPLRAVIVSSPEPLAKVREALSKGNVWATKAPLIMAMAARPSDDCRLNEGRDYYLFACGLAVGEMVLQATELGLIAHPIAGYDPVKVRNALGVPNDHVVIALVICGYKGSDDSLLSDKQE